MKKVSRNRLSVRLKLWSRFVSALILVLGFELLVAPLSWAQSQSGFVTITATVDKPPPTTPATIDTPTDGEVFHAAPISVSGSCAEEGLLIYIIDNGNFVGSTTCDASGHYSLKITPYLGLNHLVAQEVNSSNKYGPDSAAVTITYNLPTSPTPPTTTEVKQQIPQLSIVLDPHYVGLTNCQAGQSLGIPLKISGGTAPYALHVEWGDGSDSLLSQATTDSFVVAHSYSSGGTYHALMSASDSQGQTTSMEVAIIINGKPVSTPKKIIQNVQKLSRSQWPPTILFVGGGVFLLLLGYLLGTRTRRKATKAATQAERS